MANVPLGSMLTGMIKILADGDKGMKQAARMVAREGCVVAGRTIKASVRRHAPVFQRGKGLFNPYGTTYTRQKYSMAPGELRDSIYFTNSKRKFNWKAGKLRYIVGFPHATRGKVTPGWYAHFIEFGHRRVNAIVVNDKTRYSWPLTAKESRRRRQAISFVPGKPFMAPGIAAVDGSIPGIMNNAMKKQLGIEIAKLTLKLRN